MRVRTLAHDRFQIDCEKCGLLATMSHKTDALHNARMLALAHKECGVISVYDAMAHTNKMNLWQSPDFEPQRYK